MVKDLEEKEKELIEEIEEYRQIELEHQRLVDEEMKRAKELGMVQRGWLCSIKNVGKNGTLTCNGEGFIIKFYDRILIY